MEAIKAKSIISKVSFGDRWFGTDYNMNIYRGCCHGCIYCDSRSECYRIEDFDKVRIKENALEIIRDELSRKRKKHSVIASGAMSDPYNPFEEKLQLTRKSLEIINEFKFGASITTKSQLVARDADIFDKIQKHSPVIVKMTVTCADDTLSRKIEPFAAVSSERFKAIRELSDKGIFVGILMMPLLPFINDTPENITSIVRKAKESGAKFVFPSFGLTLRANQREYFYEKIDAIFPEIKSKYINTFGGKYSCNSPYMKELWNLFKNECDKLKIIYRMNEIIDAYKSKYKPAEQSFLNICF
ncbi:MAG: radical SAM protein [Endomicrobia bacterium]|nr:radical SAM protein [Endomicrobiia bacterium]